MYISTLQLVAVVPYALRVTAVSLDSRENQSFLRHDDDGDGRALVVANSCVDDTDCTDVVCGSCPLYCPGAGSWCDNSVCTQDFKYNSVDLTWVETVYFQDNCNCCETDNDCWLPDGSTNNLMCDTVTNMCYDPGNPPPSPSPPSPCAEDGQDCWDLFHMYAGGYCPPGGSSLSDCQECSVDSDCSSFGFYDYCIIDPDAGNYCAECTLTEHNCEPPDECTPASCIDDGLFVMCEYASICQEPCTGCNSASQTCDPLPSGTTCFDGSVGFCDGTGGSGSCVECLELSHCDDSNDCTFDTCDSGGCAHADLPQGTACSSVTDGMCDGSGQCVQCVSDSDCDDGIECTTDSCSSGICSNQNKGDCDVECFDDSHCTHTCDGCSCESCISGKCGPYVYALPFAEECYNQNYNKCIGSDVTGGGPACGFCTQDSECDDYNDCTVDTCDSSFMCQYTSQPSGTQCRIDIFDPSLGSGYCDGSSSYSYCAECVEDSHCVEAEFCDVHYCATPFPSKNPTKRPTNAPSDSPSNKPSTEPTKNPTSPPTANPTKPPSGSPTSGPTSSPSKPPTSVPTKSPSGSPTKSPSKNPTSSPTDNPTKNPTNPPTPEPTEAVAVVKHLCIKDNDLPNADICTDGQTSGACDNKLEGASCGGPKKCRFDTCAGGPGPSPTNPPEPGPSPTNQPVGCSPCTTCTGNKNACIASGCTWSNPGKTCS